MSNKPRFVFDNNVLVSAMLFDTSVPGRALATAQKVGVVLVSAATITELRDVLSRKKFDGYLTRDERDQFLAAIISTSTVIQVSSTIQDCRDSRDNKFLELAVDGTADYIVTGDLDLLALLPFRGIQIITPADFLALFQTFP